MTPAGPSRPRRVPVKRLVVAGALMAAAGLTFAGGFYLGSVIGIEPVRSALAALVHPGSDEGKPPGAWKVVPTMLHDVVIERHQLPDSPRTGGAIEQVAGHLVFATPEGRLGYLAADLTPRLLEVTVPMNNAGMRNDPIAEHPAFDIQYLRVTDLLTRRDAEGRFQLLVSHHHYRDGCVDFRVSALTLQVRPDGFAAAEPAMRTVFVAAPCIGFRPDNEEFVFSGHQAGGRMVPFGAAKVLLGVGDHQFDGTHGIPEGMAPGLPDERSFTMDPRVSLGKMILLDPDTGAHEVFATGVRNPQGLLRDARGRIWETEHGPQGGDELNLVERGHNYGWPEVTLGVEYGNRPWPFNPAQGRHRAFTLPRYAWVPSIGVSNLVQVPAQHFPSWQGDLLVTSLLDMTVYRLRLDDDHVVYSEPVPIGERIRDAIVLDDGRVALYADSAHAVLVLGNADGPGQTRGSAQQDAGSARSRGTIEDADAAGAGVFRANCASCHGLQGEAGVGPPLEGVLGRRVGQAPGFAYSESLGAAGDVWSDDRLRRFLRAPQTVYPGSRMTAMALSDAELDELLEFLAAQKPG